ncbi:MAG TPA: hypothetical protein VEU33_27795 [Archangium sp.]|nr:hypothetical protein [Archangium sp.]
MRAELAAQIATLTHLLGDKWNREDVALLQRHEHNLRQAYPKEADTVLNATPKPVKRLGKQAAGTLAVHSGFWILLLFFYPRSPRVQALFFWNPWVRRLMGLGYVNLLLTWLPPLQRRLLAPFSYLLLSDAELERFSAEHYFAQSEVLIPSSGTRALLLEALSGRRGHVVLEGASGLGKSTFVRHLLRHSKHLAVYLRAERCNEGVLNAIQAKLEGQARDTAFLQSIIYSGALDIYIDGLNEVTADTRARIVEFVERNSHAHILLTTQRIEWTPPTTARLYVLQPLNEAQIGMFLVSREPALDPRAPLRGADYRTACERFVREALSAERPEEERQATRESLSNPMDLTVVAQLLSLEQRPDLFNLGWQQYELMAKDYREIHLGDFPLKEFAEEAYQMRLQDRTALPEERFGEELPHLERFKLVVRRQWKSLDGKEQREWRFRHDKLHEFFIAQTFLGEGNPRPAEHLADPRFRGVYFLLALLLEPAEARALREMLVDYAAATRDHTVSDDFVNVLNTRRRVGPPRFQRPLPAVAT